MKFKAGDIVKITKENELELLKKCYEEIEVSETAFQLASRITRGASKNLWRSIHGLYPELEKYHLIYDHIKNQIFVKYEVSQTIPNGDHDPSEKGQQ